MVGVPRGMVREISPGFKSGDTVDIETIAEGARKIQRGLIKRGFLMASVTWDTALNPDGIKVNYRIAGLEIPRIARWEITGNESLAVEKLLAVLAPKRSQLREGGLSANISKLENLYRRSGFPFAEVVFSGIMESTGWVVPALSVREGPRVRLDFILFGGVAPEQEKILLRYSGFRSGTVYSPEYLTLWRRNLERSGWVRVDSEELVINGGKYGVRYWITQERTGNIFAAVGYLPDDRRLTGWAGVQLFNILQSGRQVTAEWRSISGRKRYHLSYTEPWLLGSPLTVTGSAEHNVIDTGYSFTTMAVNGTVGVGVMKFSLGSGFDRLTGIANRQTLWLKTEMLLDTRDRFSQPRRGMIGRLATRVGRGRTGTDTGAGYIGWVEADFSPLVQLGNRFVWANSFSGRGVFTTVILSDPELYAVGGEGTVRGYREAAFLTERCGWWNGELRYHFSVNSRVHIFSDVGVLEGPVDRRIDVIAGYGLGGRWQTKVGLLGIDYGIAFGEQPWQGKVHIAFETGF